MAASKTQKKSTAKRSTGGRKKTASARTSPKVEVDYIQKKQVKKVNGAKPGFVIYHNNYSLMATPQVTLEEV